MRPCYGPFGSWSLGMLLGKRSPCNCCRDCFSSPAPMAAHPHSILGFPNQDVERQSTNRPSANCPLLTGSIDDQFVREHGPPQPSPPLAKASPSSASGPHPMALGSAWVEGEGDWLGAALGVTSITVDASEASPHCFLVCVRCGRERSLLLPMPAPLFQAAIGSFAVGHRRC